MQVVEPITIVRIVADARSVLPDLIIRAFVASGATTRYSGCIYIQVVVGSMIEGFDKIEGTIVIGQWH